MTWKIQNLLGYEKTFKTNDSAEARAWMSDRSVPEGKTRRLAGEKPGLAKALAPHQISDKYSTTDKVPPSQKVKHNRRNGKVSIIKF